MSRTLVAIASVLTLAAIGSTTAHADNVTIPIKCKSPSPSSYPGPKIINDTGKVIPEGKRIRWWRTESGIGNSFGEITLKKDLGIGDSVLASDDIGDAQCKAEVDKKRPDLRIKNVWIPEPGKVKVKIANVGEWGASKAQIGLDVFACGAETPTVERTSKEFGLAKGEVKTLTFSYGSLPGGKATIDVRADPKMKVSEVSEWNNGGGTSTCPCGGGQVCGGDEGSCGSNERCVEGCCEMLPPG
jgi:hypothetical protein